MTEMARRPSANQHRAIGIWAILMVPICIFFVLVVITNTHWIPVYIPSLPWVEDPVLFAFETPLIAAISIAFLLGATVTFFAWRSFHKQFLRKHSRLQQHVSTLEATIEKTQRLVSAQRLRSQTDQPVDAAENRK